jgi:structural maintenance of chromosome 2
VRSRLSQVGFNYTPQLGFDTRKVKDLVASLLALKPEDHGKSTALEITAGGKLYNAVVENECVGKSLLEQGRIKKRVTHPTQQQDSCYQDFCQGICRPYLLISI